MPVKLMCSQLNGETCLSMLLGMTNDAAFLTQVLHGPAEVNGVPVDDCANDETEAGRPKRLTFKRTITNFATIAAALRPQDGR